MTVSSTMRYPPATVNNRRNAKSRSVCPDQGPWSMRVNRSWETLSNASAMAEHVVRLVKYSNAMRYIHSGSGIDAHLPSESLCLFLCGLPVTRISCCVNVWRLHDAFERLKTDITTYTNAHQRQKFVYRYMGNQH